MTLFKSALAAALLAAPQAFAADYPMQVTDDRAGSVTLSAQPERVITLTTFAADLMVALGKEPIAVTTYEGQRPVYLGGGVDAAVDVGDLTAPNLELMATLNPDLTVGMLRYNGPFEEEISAMGSFLAYNPGDVDKSLSNVAKLGLALGYADEAAAFNERFKQMRAEMGAKTTEEGPSFLFLWSYYDAMYAFQDNLMTTQLFSDLGAKNLVGFNQEVALAEEAFVVLEPEQLLAMNPDYLFVFASHGGPIKSSPVFERLNAVKNDKAYLMGYQYSQPVGPIAREMVLQEGAHLLYPDLFEAPDMPDAARAKPLTFAQ